MEKCMGIELQNKKFPKTKLPTLSLTEQQKKNNEKSNNTQNTYKIPRTTKKQIHQLTKKKTLLRHS